MHHEKVQTTKIAIITPSDGFTLTSINFANHDSSQETAPSWQGIQNARDNQGTENSGEFFRGKASALKTLKQITTLVTNCINILNVLISNLTLRKSNSKQLT